MSGPMSFTSALLRISSIIFGSRTEAIIWLASMGSFCHAPLFCRIQALLPMMIVSSASPAMRKRSGATYSMVRAIS